MAKTSPTKELIAPAEDPDPLGSEPGEEPPSSRAALAKVLTVKEHLRRRRECSGPIPVSEHSLQFLQTHFPHATPEDWSSWQWQLQNSICTVDRLQSFIRLSYPEIEAMSQTRAGLPLRITPYYASLMDRDNPQHPIRRAVVPVCAEFSTCAGESQDPLGEDHQSPVPGLVHRYPDRVLFLTTGFCSTYCRYCTRSRMVGNTNKFRVSIKQWDQAIAYIEATPSVRDVLLSGGDPLTLLDGQLDYLLSRIKAIPHVEFVRIGTKVPVVLPQRITSRLLRTLKKYQPWLSIHFTHPDELTPETSAACNQLADAGLPLGSQTVLLKGINDDVATLKALFQGLLKIRVRPYYLYQCDPIQGSAHFRTSVRHGLDMVQGLRGHTTGYAVPQYVLDTPGGGGKIPLQPEYYQGTDNGEIILKNYAGELFRYPDEPQKGTGLRVGLTYDLRDDYLKQGFSQEETAEFDRLDTIEGIEASLKQSGYQTDRIGNAKQLVARLGHGERWDLVFNIAEGQYGIGREALVPQLLDAYRIPYTFSDPLVMTLTLHKGMTKQVVRNLGVPTADFAVVETLADIDRIDLPFPLFVKPVAEGTGKGITQRSKVDSRQELYAQCTHLLQEFHQPVLVETYLPGREFTAGLVGTGNEARCIGVMEVTFNRPAQEDLIYSYHNKAHYEELIAYRIPEADVLEQCKDLALRAWKGLGCRDGGRIDIRMDANGVPNFIEVNPLAGLNPVHSDLPIICSLVGTTFKELIDAIMHSALKRTVPAKERRERTSNAALHL